MEKAHTQETLQLTERLAKTTNWFLGAALLGVVLCAVAWFQNAKFFFVSYLTAFSFFLAIALGALFFVMVQHLARAGWSVTVRRTAETVSGNLWVLCILFLPLFLGVHELFHWTHEELRATD